MFLLFLGVALNEFGQQMTRLEQLHRLKIKLQNQFEQLRLDAEMCSSYPQVWKRYDHVVCNTERALSGAATG